MYQQIILIGNLGNEPELRHTASGLPVCSFRLAVNKRWTTPDGEKRDKTTWFRVSTWQKQAELVSQYLSKGRQVMVIGEVEEANAYTTKTGEAAATIEVTARLVKFLGGDHTEDGDDEAMLQTQASTPVNGKKAPAKRQLAEADIPF
jgi:single-strand DNA-binding protein